VKSEKRVVLVIAKQPVAGIVNKPIRHVVCAGALGQVKTDT